MHGLLVRGVLCAAAACGTVQAAGTFEHLAVRLEQNVTDEDVEVVFEATSGDDGLAALRVTGPDGRTVLDFKSPDTKLGVRHLVLESPERVNDGRVQQDFPAGAYAFAGTTVTGERLAGTATLRHQLPGAASLLRPPPKAKNVPLTGTTLEWRVPKGVAAVIVVVEAEKTGLKALQTTLPGTVTRLALPDGLLAPGTEYKFEVGTVGSDGNRSFVETHFTTAGRK